MDDSDSAALKALGLEREYIWLGRPCLYAVWTRGASRRLDVEDARFPFSRPPRYLHASIKQGIPSFLSNARTASEDHSRSFLHSAIIDASRRQFQGRGAEVLAIKDALEKRLQRCLDRADDILDEFEEVLRPWYYEAVLSQGLILEAVKRADSDDNAFSQISSIDGPWHDLWRAICCGRQAAEIADLLRNLSEHYPDPPFLVAAQVAAVSSLLVDRDALIASTWPVLERLMGYEDVAEDLLFGDASVASDESEEQQPGRPRLAGIWGQHAP